MIADRNSGNTSPLTWAGSYPVYLSTVLAAGHALTLVATGLAMAAGAERLLHVFEFSTLAVRDHFALWQFVTYAFVHPPNNLLFLLELYLLVVFGRQIEQFLGRRAFAGLYAALLLLPPLVLLAASFAGFPQAVLHGSGALHFAVFVAFATLYPSADVFFGIAARWVAAALVAFNLLQSLALGDRTGLVVMLVDCGAAWLMVLWMRGALPMPDWGALAAARRRPRLRVMEPPPEATATGIDDILEKISRSGMSSLTAAERRRLERERDELLEKERKR